MTVPNKPALNLREIAPILGVSESTIYAAARQGNLPFPVMKINSRYVVPTKPFLEALGLNPEVAA